MKGSLNSPALLTKAEAVLFPTLLLSAWEIVARLSLLPPSLSASPSDVLTNLAHLLADGPILKHTLISLVRLFTSATLGTLLGIASGLLLAQSTHANRIISPTLQLLAPVPVVVWIPFVIMVAGSGELYKIAVALIATFFLVHLHVFEATIAIERDFIELALIYEKSAWDLMRHILLPAALPSIFTAVRLSLAIGWVIIFFSEASTSRLGSEGLGWFITDARAVGRIEDEYAGVVLLAIVGGITDRIASRLQRRSLAWADTLVATSLTQQA